MRRLVDAVLMVGSDLDLDAMLQRIIEAAVHLVDARYGALGVLDENEDRLAQFITVGIDDDAARRIGDPPGGLGLLGSLITDARPLRVAHLTEHGDSSGFPPNHPPMTSFLGVPIRVRDKVFGNLYLTDKTSGEVFTDVDEELAASLAAAAGVAIENARLYEQGRRREAALTAMKDLATSLTPELDETDSLELVAHHARELLDGVVAAIATPSSTDELVWEAADGVDIDLLRGETLTRTSSLVGDALRTGATHAVPDGAAAGPTVAVILHFERVPSAVLVVARSTGGACFTNEDVAIAEVFAAQASAMLDRMRTRRRTTRLSLPEDQGRIAGDLLDAVIQDLFSVGLSLQAALPLVADARASDGIGTAIEQLDRTVGRIRMAIFGLESGHA